MLNDKYTNFIAQFLTSTFRRLFWRVATLLFLGANVSPASAQLHLWQDGHYTFRRILNRVKMGTIDPLEAHDQFVRQWQQFQAWLPPNELESELVFPLWQRNASSVGGKGRGYRPNGFDLFNRLVSGSHPAQDIFIWDRNKDGREDLTGTFWPILAVRAGVIVDVNTAWDTTSTDRGGKYIWQYDAATGGLWYYAHLEEIHVLPGQWVEAGQPLGTLGRTGKNAWAKRSDSHLHLMYLALDSLNQVVPRDSYAWLKQAKTSTNDLVIVYDRTHITNGQVLTTPPIRLHTPVRLPVWPAIVQRPIVQGKPLKK